MWVLVVIVGLAVELVAIVLLGRSVTRRDDAFDGDRPAFTAVVDHDRATIVARGPWGPHGAEVLRDAAESLRTGGHQRITVQLPRGATGDPVAKRVLTGLAEELSRSGLRMRLEWLAQADRPVPGLIPEPRRGD